MKITSSCIETDELGYEITRHGTVLFPIAHYTDDISKNPVNWHWHDELEVGIIKKGSAIITSGTLKYRLKEGEGFFINRNVFHAAWSKDSSCILNSIVFHPRLVGSTVDSIFWQKYIQPLLSNSTLNLLYINNNLDWMTKLLSHVDYAWKLCHHKPAGYELEVRNHLSKLVFLLVQNLSTFGPSPSDSSRRQEERIKIMLQFIHCNYNDDIDATSIAKSALISNTECLRCFHNIIGTTPIQYLKEYRIQRAAELLQTTSMKISDIGEKCGFQDMSYFGKTFKELKAMTPGEFRKAKPQA